MAPNSQQNNYSYDRHELLKLFQEKEKLPLSPLRECVQLGKHDAKTKLLITVGVHGDEPCGMHGFNELLDEGFFDSLPDSVRLTVLVGNPAAVSKNQRFIEYNLNRMIRDDLFKGPSYEAQRAKVVADAIDQCDVLLDLHSCSAKAPPHALPSGSVLSAELASKLPVGYVIKCLAHTTSGRATTIDWGLKKNKVAVCVECGQHTERDTIDNAKNCIKAFLSIYTKGACSSEMKTKYTRPIILKSKENEPVRKGFKFTRPVTAFERVPYGEVIATDVLGDIKSKYVTGTYIVMPTRNPVLGEEAFFCAEAAEHYYD